jgi:hypothetical protein
MGTVPVAPNMNRLESEGDRKVSGFIDKPVARGLNNMEMRYIPTLTAMITFTNRSESLSPRVQVLFFHQELGFFVPQ